MIDKIYLKDLIKKYNISLCGNNFKVRIQKRFEVKKDTSGNYIIANMLEIETFMQEIKMELEIKNSKNPIEKIELKINSISEMNRKKYKFTINSFYKFATEYIKKSNSTRILETTNIFFNTLNFIIMNTDTDICNMNNEEVCKLITKNINSRQKPYLVQYLKYVKENYKNEIQFTLNVNYIENHKVKTSEYFYTNEEWLFYTQYLCDIDEHICKAFKNKCYAKYWLFYILHLSLTWRKNDILNIPALDLLDIEKYSLKWFYENEFTVNDALYIVSNTKLYVEQQYTQKTGAKLHFNVSMNLIIPTAIAILIMEHWRRKENAKTLFITKTMGNATHKLFEGKMDKFSSLKANRTLLSLANGKADELKLSKAISVGSYMRSHSLNYYNVSDTTKVYLKTSYDEKELHSISKSLFEKGAFGWLFDYVISVYEDNKTIRFKSYDIDVLENLSGYLVSQDCNKQSVLNELLQYSKEELEDILMGNRSSKQECIYCIKDVCDRTLNCNCLECKYSIPTVYAMHAVADEVTMLLNKYKQIDKHHIRDKEHCLYRLLKMLGVAKSFGNVYGENTLNSFLDYDEILQQTKLLIEGE